MTDQERSTVHPLWVLAGIVLLAVLGVQLSTGTGERESPRASEEAAADSARPEVASSSARRNGGALEEGTAAAGEQEGDVAIAAARRAGTPGHDAERDLSPAFGRALTDVIQLLNADRFAEATAALEPLMTADAMAGMTPFEISRLYQLSFQLNMEAENYEAAQADLQAALESGGLNEQEVSRLSYQRAQLFLQMEDYAKAADTLELWIADEGAAARQSAYYLLAASYYYQDKFDDARDHIETLFTLPGEKQESWYAMMSALYLKNEDYAKALPVVEKMVELYGDETYRSQRAALYLQTGDFVKAETALEEMVALYSDDTYRKQLDDVRRLNRRQ